MFLSEKTGKFLLLFAVQEDPFGIQHCCSLLSIKKSAGKFLFLVGIYRLFPAIGYITMLLGFQIWGLEPFLEIGQIIMKLGVLIRDIKLKSFPICNDSVYKYPVFTFFPGGGRGLKRSFGKFTPRSPLNKAKITPKNLPLTAW